MYRVLSFEENIQQLEQIVSSLEKGDMTLDKMLEMFEKGVNLSRKCALELENAEKKVQIILKKGNPEEGIEDYITDFDASNTDEPKKSDDIGEGKQQL